MRLVISVALQPEVGAEGQGLEVVFDGMKSKRDPTLAVWAGWGHASENPKLPELLHRNGIIFIGKSFLFSMIAEEYFTFFRIDIGPPEQAMWALGRNSNEIPRFSMMVLSSRR